MNSFLQLFSRVYIPDLPELTVIFISLFIVLQRKYSNKMDFNFAEWKIVCNIMFFTLCFLPRL